MKTMKKMMALMIAMAMTLAMSVTAFATGETPAQKTITINNPVAGHTYTAYQILSGEVVEAELTKIDWGIGITDAGKSALKKQLELDDGATVAKVADALSKIISDSDSMDAVAQVLGDNIVEGTGDALTIGGDGKATATVAQGYYVILDSITGQAPVGSTISKYMVQVVGDVAINTKAQKTTSQKTVLDGEDAKAKFTEANIGEERTFYLTAKLPADYAAYEAFYMNFRDKMNHMDFVGLTSVTVKRDVVADNKGVLDPKTGNQIAEIKAQEGTEKINGYELTSPTAPDEDEVTSDESNDLFVKLLDLKQIVGNAQAGDCVIVEYKAKLNASAVINGANVNEFDLVFSNDPNNTVKPTTPNEKPEIPTGVTPKDEADLYTTEIELLKQDGTTKDILTGAEFTLTGDTNNVVIKTATEFVEAADGEYWKLKNDTYTKTEPTEETSDLYADTEKKYTPTVTTKVETNATGTNIKAFVGSDGKVTFTGLGEGDYTLTESKVPDGYNKMDDIKFAITFNKDTKKFEITGGLKSLVATIDNFSGSTLPSTGGIGTTIFYIVGAVLVIGAAILLVTKKRMSKEA